MTSPDFLNSPFDAHRIPLGAGKALVYWTLGARTNADGSARPVLIALHGMRDVGRSLAPIAHRLANQYFVVLPDLRGHGSSVAPGSYAIAHFLMDLRRLIKQIDAPTVALLGHSLGGHICCRYAGIYTTEIEALVVLEGLGPPLAKHPDVPPNKHAPTYSPPEEDPALLAQRLDEAIATSAFAQSPRVLPNRADAARRLKQNNPGLGDAYAQKLSEWLTIPAPAPNEESGVRWCFDPCVQEVFLGISHNRGRDYWRRISAPTLIVFGDRGHEYWRAMRNEPGYTGRFEAQDLKERLGSFQNVEQCVIPAAGHQLHYDQPKLVAERCETFLKNAAKHRQRN